MNCPNCGCATIKGAGTVFIEGGEWDGKCYEAEGTAYAYLCTSCGKAFAVDIPLPEPTGMQEG